MLFGSIIMHPLARRGELEARRRLLLPQLLASEVVAGLVNVKTQERGAVATLGWTLDLKDLAPSAVGYYSH